MDSSTLARIKRRGRSMSLTGIIIALSIGVLLPVLLSTAVGIVTLALGKNSNPIVTGVLIVSFAAAAIGSIVTVTILLSKRARTVRLQADLLANVSHDLRTPLSSIRLYAQTIQSGKLDNEPELIHESLETIIRETQWLDSMIDRLLTWRAAAKDRAILQMKTKPVGEAVEIATRRFLSMIPEREVEFHLEITSQASVNHDPQAIESIVLNLLLNAYKYTGSEKHIRVTVEDRYEKVAISVCDNGIGILPKEIHKIFEPFYRIDTKLASKASGAGLGLSIVRYLTRSHDGEVMVKSGKEGSCFTVLLPTALEAKHEEHHKEHDEANNE